MSRAVFSEVRARERLRYLVLALLLVVGACEEGESVPAPRTATSLRPVDGRSEPNPDPLGEDAIAAAEHFDVDVATARRYLARQDDVARLGSYLRDRVETFGGLYLDYDPRYAVVLLSVPRAGARLREAVRESPYRKLLRHVIIREVGWTERTLRGALGTIDELTPHVEKAMSTNIERGLIEIYVETRRDVRRIRAAIAGIELTIPPHRILFHVEPFAEPELP